MFVLKDRFVAYHASILYYWYVNAFHKQHAATQLIKPYRIHLHHILKLTHERLTMFYYLLPLFFCLKKCLLFYRFLVILFIVSPGESYRFSKLLELHAVDTYRVFLEENETTLKRLPVPDIAKEYYANFLYYFYEFHHTMAEEKSSRIRPELDSLFDVFDNILLDEVCFRSHFDVTYKTPILHSVERLTILSATSVSSPISLSDRTLQNHDVLRSLHE